MKKGILIGIAGASGSGKTHVANSIIERLGSDKAVIIQEDSYYKDLSDMPYEERVRRNFDHPDAFDYDLLARHLFQLLNGEAVSHPIYDYKLHTRSKETKNVGPCVLIILEGILILNNARLRELMDFSVFIDTALDICFVRRLKRDIEERGRTVDSIIRQYTETVRPMYIKFIAPSKQYADILISGEGGNSDAVDNLTTRIDALLNNSNQ
ncbi:MAG: uridine kinase [Sedimentisphaerales bacterium]|nr:uridine kinase [Sedimentisphaerales bacterium]